MALLFFDNFGGYAIADIGKIWSQVTGLTPTLSSTGGRNNLSYLSTANNGQNNQSSVFSPIFSTSQTFVVGFAYYSPTTISTANPFIIMNIIDGNTNTVQCSLGTLPSGQLAVYRGDTTALNTSGTSSLGLVSNTWYYIEIKVTIADSIGAGTCEVKVNNITWVTVDAGQDLKAGTNAFANHIRFGRCVNGASDIRLTDIYIDNGTTFLGDCTVSTLTVSGAGTTNTLTTGTFADVDDALVDSDSTYAESAVNGQLATFAMSNLPGTPTTIHAVSPRNCVRKTDGGTKQFGAVVRSGGTDYVQATANALDSFIYDAPILTVDPATGVAWVAAGVNAVEVGVKVLS